ncbi:MAG: hypothetical protein LBD87_04575 [Prevotellaceae bacterium]|jgi:uncharacterized protein (TIGR02145 family)|nr:hypothetical protein [Prevotellaceae bacterium]
MRTTLFFSLMFASVAANATVTVTPLSTDYTAKKVTFSVSWTSSPTAPYNNRVWIWIDFCPVSGVTPQSFSTATITSPAKTDGNGTITGLNGRGFFIEYAATNAGTTVTATLSNATGKFNWCVYGSDYPPNVTLDKGTYTFKGTTNFIVSSHAQPVTTKTIARTSLTITSQSTFTDATGCPGIGQLYCPYTGSDLIMDATHLCQQRTSGAKNWQAYIQDSRDSEIYRIVLMPDGKWWLAQNVKYAGTGETITVSGCTKELCGRWYTYAQFKAAYGGTSGYGENKQGVCPNGWVLPTQNNWTTFNQSISSNNTTICQSLRHLSSTCSPKPDTYGWASGKSGSYKRTDGKTYNGEHWWSNESSAECNVCYDHYRYVSDQCNRIDMYCPTSADQALLLSMPVRCFRQL